MDYKEYSRLRSIARKRIERASAAGAIPYVQIPTVKEIRASGNPEQYLNAVRNFLNNPAASLSSSRKQGTKMPEFTAPVSEKPKKPPKNPPLSPDAKRARRNEQKRRSKAKRAVEKASKSPEESKKRVGYLKALETVSKKWKEAGIDAGNWLGVLSPKKAKAFVDYMEYRFSQGDYNNKYTIDTFIRDFGEMVARGYNFDDIKSDFGTFLDKQKQLNKNAKRTNKYGVTEDEIDTVWRKFVKGV